MFSDAFDIEQEEYKTGYSRGIRTYYKGFSFDADFSFAMENGSDYAKNTAKYIADTNDNAGVAKAIMKYVFGE